MSIFGKNRGKVKGAYQQNWKKIELSVQIDIHRK